MAALDELGARGFAQRQPDPVDRRSNVITITKRGTGALERLDLGLDDGKVSNVGGRVAAPWQGWAAAPADTCPHPWRLGK